MMKTTWKIGVNRNASRLNGSAPSGAGWSGVGTGVGVGETGTPLAPGEPAEAPSLTVADLDHLLDDLLAATGTVSAALRQDTLQTLGRRATADEQQFVTRVLIGEMRTGALEGVLVDAVAKASEVPGATVRRAVMLSGDLGETARLALTGGADALKQVGLAVGTPVLPMLASTAAAPGTTATAAAGWRAARWW